LTAIGEAGNLTIGITGALVGGKTAIDAIRAVSTDIFRRRSRSHATKEDEKED
jgi:hypothetical protein